MANILITGGSGLIGTALTSALLADGHAVRHLGRTSRSVPGIRSYVWDVMRGTMDRATLSDVDHIIHLAGAGIAEKRWTTARVKELIDSRTESARLLLHKAQEQQVRVKSFISAAGINYYGAITRDHVFAENDAAASDTIGTISRLWEEAVDEWAPHTRVVKLRTPVVLTPNGGALAKLAAPVRYGLGSALGRGKQWREYEVEATE